jgi:hypothetical protein
VGFQTVVLKYYADFGIGGGKFEIRNQKIEMFGAQSARAILRWGIRPLHSNLTVLFGKKMGGLCRFAPL